MRACERESDSMCVRACERERESHMRYLEFQCVVMMCHDAGSSWLRRRGRSVATDKHARAHTRTHEHMWTCACMSVCLYAIHSAYIYLNHRPSHPMTHQHNNNRANWSECSRERPMRCPRFHIWRNGSKVHRTDPAFPHGAYKYYCGPCDSCPEMEKGEVVCVCVCLWWLWWWWRWLQWWQWWWWRGWWRWWWWW